MSKILESKACAWGAFIIVILVIALTFTLRKVAWWAFCDIFFAFMMVFCHLLATYITRLNVAASRKLDVIAAVCGVIAILAGVGEYIAFQMLFS